MAHRGQVQRPTRVVSNAARIPPAVGIRFDGRQAHLARQAPRPLPALHVAACPPFLKPANVAQFPQRRINGRQLRNEEVFALERGLKFGEKLQRMIARIHERQRQQLSPRDAHSW